MDLGLQASLVRGVEVSIVEHPVLQAPHCLARQHNEVVVAESRTGRKVVLGLSQLDQALNSAPLFVIAALRVVHEALYVQRAGSAEESAVERALTTEAPTLAREEAP